MMSLVSIPHPLIRIPLCLLEVGVLKPIVIFAYQCSACSKTETGAKGGHIIVLGIKIRKKKMASAIFQKL